MSGIAILTGPTWDIITVSENSDRRQPGFGQILTSTWMSCINVALTISGILRKNTEKTDGISGGMKNLPAEFPAAKSPPALLILESAIPEKKMLTAR